MNDVVSLTPDTQNHPLLRRRNSITTSIAVLPTKLTLLPHQNSSSSSSTTTTSATSSSSYSFPSDDLELLPIKPVSQSYTSLRDLLPSVAVNSPKPNAVNPTQVGSDICIRNRLVKQAAWAYLQPMSTSSGYSDGNPFHRLWPRVAAFFDFVLRKLIQALDSTLRIFRIRSSV